MCFAPLPGFLSSYKDAGEQCEAAACITLQICVGDVHVINDTGRCESTLVTLWDCEEIRFQ